MYDIHESNKYPRLVLGLLVLGLLVLGLLVLGLGQILRLALLLALLFALPLDTEVG